MKIADGLLGLFFLLLGGLQYWQASQFPSFSGQPYGAAFLPSILSVGFMIAGMLLVLRDVQARRHRSADTPDGAMPLFAWVPDLRQGGLLPLLVVLGNVLAQILAAPKLGFLPVSVVGLTALFLAVRLPAWLAGVLAVATSLGCWWLFVGLLRVPLPRGILDGVL